MRGNNQTDTDLLISGPEQTRSVDFTKELHNNKFKQALVRFFLTYWSNNEMTAFIKNKKIFVSYCEYHVFYNCFFILKCSDTDILIIMLSNMSNLKSNSKIYMEYEVSGKTKFIDICKIYKRFWRINLQSFGSVSCFNSL